MITVERHEKRSKTSLIFEKIFFFKFLAEKRHYDLSLMGREANKHFFPPKQSKHVICKAIKNHEFLQKIEIKLRISWAERKENVFLAFHKSAQPNIRMLGITG